MGLAPAFPSSAGVVCVWTLEQHTDEGAAVSSLYQSADKLTRVKGRVSHNAS